MERALRSRIVPLGAHNARRRSTEALEMTRITQLFHGRPIALRRAALAAALMFALVNLVGGLTRGQSEADIRPATDVEIAAFLTEQIRDAGYPGAAFAIIRDGRVTLSRGIGIADDAGRPVTADTPFVIGSLSKAITAMAVMQLVEAGAIALDAPVTTYLPDFTVAGDGAGHITVRHLLHQTSGLPPLAGVTPLSGPVTSLEAQVDALRAVELAAAPGSSYAYSNANYAVLGHVVERVSGRPFGTYVADEIFAPLGMDHSHVDLADASADGLTDAHRFWFGNAMSGEPLWRPDSMPAGWLIASADDLGRFVAANLGGGTLDRASVLSPGGVEQLHRGAVSAGRSEYGMGWFDGRRGTTRVVSHSGSTTDMASAMYLAPDQKVGLVVLYNGQSLVYELLHKGEAIAEAAMAKLIGESAGGTLNALYPAFTVAVVLMVALQLRALIRAARRARRGEPTVRPLFGKRMLGLAAATWSWMLVPAFVLWSTPDTLGAPWTVLVHIDLGQALAAYAVLQLLIGAVSLAPIVARHVSAPAERSHRASGAQGVG
jgi:CubicO group peptidase (beta-lactamase class C family)